MSLVQEAKEHLTRKIAPTLARNVTGRFQVHLFGLYRNHADIAVALVNEANEIVKYFGRGPVKVGNATWVNDIPSVWNEPGTPAIECYFQAWIMGIDQGHAECEIGIRLVDANQVLIKHVGSMTKKPGENLTFEGMEVKLSVIPERFLQ